MKTTKTILVALLLFCNLIFANFDPTTAQEYRKVIAMRNTGQAAESIALFDQVIAKDPKMLYVFFERGLAQHQLGKFDLAIADYLKDNELNPNHSSYNLACAYSISGKKLEAVKYLKLAQASIYNQTAKWLNEDTDLENIRKDPEFIKLADESKESAYQKLINEGNNAFYQEINFPKAAELFGKAIALDLKNPLAYRARANSNLMANKHETVLADLDKALSLNDISGAYYCNVLKAKIYQVNKNYAKACEMYDLAMSMNPQWAGEFDACYAHFMNGNKEKAYQMAKELSSLNEKDTELLTATAIFANNVGKYDEAIDLGKKALKIIQAETNIDYNKQSAAQSAIGDAYNNQKNYQKSAWWYREAVIYKNAESEFKAGVAVLNWIGIMPDSGADGATKKDWKYRTCSHLEAAKRDGYVDKMNTYENFCGK